MAMCKSNNSCISMGYFCMVIKSSRRKVVLVLYRLRWGNHCRFVGGSKKREIFYCVQILAQILTRPSA